MHSFPTKIGEGIHRVEAVTVVCGADVAVCIGGGERHHIGAAALAVPRPSLQDQEKVSATASVICATGHKEDELARWAALKLAASLNCRVNVTAGLHIDGAAASDFDKLTGNFQRVVEVIENTLIKELAPQYC
ncbi:Hypothetical protein LUCI_2188 [Lucifera butyrica]|uniref:Prenylated flavin chaperone LpdD-like domain-containing protein n=1 Tax=Lucifera butyrica TaxID=1351585 RepID=A0A498R2T8_9FIRM|nr:hypothetical protein [Lucifera butyrica]VBB06946.1 Hypothetical protein LUCI_2188 [Lucifera butyrica]